jgi:hypothetical protein
MALSREQRAELESRGADNVRQKLFESGSGRGAVVRGFKCGEIERGEVEDWLAEKANRTARIAFAPSELAVFADRCPIDQLKHVIVRAGDGEGRHSGGAEGPGIVLHDQSEGQILRALRKK